ncbi:bacillithiol biosynthesis cysteine-adding enzyme BshC [Halalkalibacter krulwichiae]|uniref:Putative cysteine ligase BshC n=1 Tax=Halalkalibacter krulwichiae TaxID=199441 RepID=A0A1X9MG74_9BACI|nr:bacillithiol biosynthesis cysteine-adding enzyme BshC [Halalkalibacter krulwichiae]ARK31103.1 hypothetical protein BkAM31D_15305 [Halalkalibacter krulwichiae]
MEVIEIDVSNRQGFLNDYINGHHQAAQFFDYSLSDKGMYENRLDDLLSRSFQRAELADYFSSIHEPLLFTTEAKMQIEKLRQPNSVVVVGGQQAGLLTGPLYTVYKAISIIHLAKQKENELGIPVVPIFWIAGEDHDLDEIRYVYIEKNNRWKKHLYNDTSSNSASNIPLNKVEMEKWLTTVFESLPETIHTKSLSEKAIEFLNKAETITDFFKHFMNWLFGKEGLLLLDAHDPTIRELEQKYFQRMIEQVEKLQLCQQKGAKEFASAGYGEPIITEAENAHLFIEVEGERKRLDFQDNSFVIRGTDLTYSKLELSTLLKDSPEKFSNNVVTRPLMQEWLLPVLSFISGPGEVLYWATLKPVFEHFELKMPIVTPRIQLTFVPTTVSKWLKETNYDILPFLEGKSDTLREEWLSEVTEYPVQEVLDKVRSDIIEHHLPLRELAEQMDPTLERLSKKNLAILTEQIDFMERKMQSFVRQSHELTLSKFNETGRVLAPLNRPQERVFHPILLLNIIGEEGFDRLLSLELSHNQKHKLLYL